MTRESTFPTRRDGSALIAAVVFTTIIVLGLAGLLPMLLTDWKQNSRTSAQEAAFSLAESGIEEAVWAVSEYGTDDDSWTDAGWNESKDGAFWYREWQLSDYSKALGDVYTLDEGRDGRFRVIVQKADSATIDIVSQGIVRGGANVPAGMEVARYIETRIRRPNPLAYGLIARRYMALNGRPTFDSYDSRIFPFYHSPGVNDGDKATVGGPSDMVADFKTTNVIVEGDAAWGGPEGGSHPFDGNSVTGSLIYEFDMDFPPVDAPDTGDGTWKTTL